MPCREGGPEPGAGYRGRDLGKRVSLQAVLEFGGQCVAFGAHVAQLRGDSGDDPAERGGAGDDDGLRVERCEDLGRHRLGQPRGSESHDLGDAVLAEVAQRLRGRGSDDQVEHPAALQTRSEQAFQGGVDVQQGVAEPVGQAGGLGGEVVVVARHPRHRPLPDRNQDQRPRDADPPNHPRRIHGDWNYTRPRTGLRWWSAATAQTPRKQ